MSSRKQITIEKAKLFLVEGKDAYYFFIWACRAFNINDIQVVDFGGIDDFSSFLETLKGISGYEGVSTILIARDAENNAEGALKV
jgi:sugar phosphate isomerase/epimerase